MNQKQYWPAEKYLLCLSRSQMPFLSASVQLANQLPTDPEIPADDVRLRHFALPIEFYPAGLYAHDSQPHVSRLNTMHRQPSKLFCARPGRDPAWNKKVIARYLLQLPYHI